MPSLLWRPGAFADRHPRSALDIGRHHKVEAAANRLLFDTAGVTSDQAIVDAQYGYAPTPYPCDGPPRGCCGSPPCPSNAQGVDTSCSRGTCTCGTGEDAFSAVYPEAAAALEESHALAAAYRDILTDPDVEDVGSALDQAQALAAKGQLAALYAPATPAKKLPSGADAPARCPICGCTVCMACGCSCSCVPSSHEKPEPAADGAAA